MGTPRRPPNVKFICGILTADVGPADRARELLGRVLGSIDDQAGPWPFDNTTYYTDEMGSGLQRWFVSFERLEPPDRLSEIKHVTNQLEVELATEFRTAERRRPVNLDPGYVALEKLVLATTKNHAHRMYMGEGIYGEVTLRYTDRRWQPWPWTYPDYARETYHAFLTRVRETLHEQLKRAGPEESPSCFK